MIRKTVFAQLIDLWPVFIDFSVYFSYSFLYFNAASFTFFQFVDFSKRNWSIHQLFLCQKSLRMTNCHFRQFPMFLRQSGNHQKIDQKIDFLGLSQGITNFSSDNVLSRCSHVIRSSRFFSNKSSYTVVGFSLLQNEAIKIYIPIQQIIAKKRSFFFSNHIIGKSIL